MTTKTMPAPRSRIARVPSLARLMLLLLAVLSIAPFALAQNAPKLVGGTITDFAGSTDPNASQAYDGVPANDSQILTPYFTALDADGNLYFTYVAGGSVGVSVIYAGNKVPPILALRVPNPKKGYQYRVAGTLSPTLSDPVCVQPSPCGDGGPALLPAGSTNPFIAPFGISVDAAGNLYVSDEVEQAVRKISATDGFISTIAGDPNHIQYGYAGDGGAATSALLSYPNAAKFDAAGNLYIADAGNYLIRRIDTNGTITTVAGNTSAASAANGSQSLPPSCSLSSDSCGEGGDPLSATLGFVFGMSFDPSGNLYLAESDIHVVREITLPASSPKIFTIAGQLRTACSPSGTAPACGDTGLAANAQLNTPQDVAADASGNLVISDTVDNAIRLYTVADKKIQTIAGQISASGGYSGDNGPATAATLNFPNGISLDANSNLYISDGTNSLIRQVSPSLTFTIDFPAIAPATYGDAPVTLDATVKETGQPVASYKVLSGPGTISNSTLVINGAGKITVEADQPGEGQYGAAAPVTQTVTVAPAVLTITADSLSRPLNSNNPTLTYTPSGFVNSDTSAVLSGKPTLSTSATESSPAGSYPITITRGTLSAANYTFAFVNGVLNVTLGQAQSITFPAISDTSYGANAITLKATATSGLPITYTVSGPAQVQGSTLVIDGAGSVTVTATQPGNANYSAATPVSRTFNVAPATLTITANSVSRSYGAANPAFTYSATGLVGGDTTAVLSGAPIFTTTADATSNAGTYPITITQGNLFSRNYTFAFVPGVLTVTKAAQMITFGDVRDLPYGQIENITATSNSGNPIQFKTTGPVTSVVGTSGSNYVLTITSADIGPVTVTATQAESQNYAASGPVTVSFNVVRAPLNVYIASVSRPVGAPNPVFQYTLQTTGITDPVAPPYVSGVPILTTTADTSSPPGTYPITGSLGTLTAEHYYFVFVPGTLTVTSASTFIVTTTPTSITVPRGSTRQLTVTVAQVNNYSGDVTLGCSGLPAGVSCSFSPAVINIPVPTVAGNTIPPLQGTLTISANGSTSTIPNASPVRSGFLFIPAFLAGLLLLHKRRDLLRNGIVLVMILGLLGFFSACGGSSSNGQPKPGSTVIQVTGSGTPSAGASNLNQSVTLNLTIQ